MMKVQRDEENGEAGRRHGATKLAQGQEGKKGKRRRGLGIPGMGGMSMATSEIKI
ncbi:MAG: hypothetical protein ACLSGS_01330 [Adlercreutzia sp.]